MGKMSFTDGIIEVIAQAMPAFIVICFVFILLSWIRLLLDYMSGRNF